MTTIELHDVPRFAGWSGAFSVRFAIWRERRRARRALAEVALRELRDAGLSREAAEFEAGLPFWRPLASERK